MLLAACASRPPRDRPASPSAPTAPASAATSDAGAPAAAPARLPARPAPEPRPSNRERLAALLPAGSCRGDLRAAAGPFQPRHLARVLGERNDLFSWVLAELHARRLPGQFIAMPVLESAYQADPGNRGAVRGLWQFSGATARRFGLHVEGTRDQRLDPVSATRAALDHLAEMWRRWGDWRLAVVGFNAGEYAVTRALRRDPLALEQARLPRGLPSRSLAYVERSRAVSCLLLDEPSLAKWMDATPELLVVGTLPAGLRSLDDAAQWLGSDVATLTRLNPSLAGQRFPLRDAATVLVPSPTGPKGPPALSAVPRDATAPAPAPADGHDSQRIHRVQRGDSPWSIARRHRIALRDLLRWNGLRSDSVLQPGQRLRLEP